MAKIRTLVTFQSPVFNTTERRDYFINDCCYGDDVARTLLKLLTSHGVQADAEPGQEDYGWYFGFHAGDTEYQFVLGYRSAEGGDPGIWIGWVERKVGLVGSLLGVRKRDIQSDGVRTIHSAICALPQVNNIRWHRQEDFDGGKEELGQSDPAT